MVLPTTIKNFFTAIGNSFVKIFTLIKDFIWPGFSDAEPVSVRVPKKWTKIIFMLGVAGYFVWKCIQLASTEVSVSTSRDKADFIPMPKFSSDYNFTVVCIIVYMDGTFNKLPAFGPNNTDSGRYVARFEQELNFGIPSTTLTNGTLSNIEFDITIRDQFYSIGSSDARIQVNMFDSDTEAIYKSPGGQPKVVSDYVATLFNANLYNIAKGFSSDIGMERSLRKVLLPDARNLIVGQATYVDINLLATRIAPVPLITSDITTYATVTVHPTSYLVITETENSDSSVLDVLSAVGGIYGTAMTFYIILFGADRVGAPWGLYQIIPPVKRDVRKELAVLAEAGLFKGSLVHKAGANTETNEGIPEKEDVTLPPETVNRSNVLSLEEKQAAMEERQTTMENRQIALEVFLKDYVLEVDYVFEE
ncbi:6544_t:CDS:2 [Paraglomus brasilianum]|uniref:6544_t:CDS:1 n=1 Tax=Paraglomus brasilianum TaxID=144538 RepID=A0A9N9CJK7_9GLOM|nr:6544_t:CDS:2 [Paraglomus brasilianum]